MTTAYQDLLNFFKYTVSISRSKTVTTEEVRKATGINKNTLHRLLTKIKNEKYIEHSYNPKGWKWIK